MKGSESYTTVNNTHILISKLSNHMLLIMARSPQAISYFIHRGAEMEMRRYLLKTSHGYLLPLNRARNIREYSEMSEVPDT